ncbi:MAG: ferric reductase-like transmembrane domain-containing protein [Deltaproteobacteria bacterium]|uniref:ferric reductase-like transmembrane domain-containing protein n=1 Tax=Desulfobacula sp. TaxID=2593537 RepID=UPI0019B95A4C|nr:ferric reductase-like transmembrane domain-containing protein [Candidatus Desulfobacula maris]MBL6993914.1 ferric reductase-like transmembrane domain-containing protein [Desulfobacula sp.]
MKNNSFLRLTGIFVFGVVLYAACTIPFYFESPSMYYKTGMDRLMLRSGKIFGIITTVLLLFQVVLASRLQVLNQVFTAKKLFQYHRTNGLILFVSAMIHPILILGADHFVFFPFESRYWPEFIGVFLLMVLLPFVLLSVWQKKLGLNYNTWKLFHKTLAPVILILLFIHAMNVSRSFESGWPFYLLSAAGLIMVFLFARRALP